MAAQGSKPTLILKLAVHHFLNFVVKSNHFLLDAAHSKVNSQDRGKGQNDNGIDQHDFSQPFLGLIWGTRNNI
jgi:hypothetical protein